MRAAAVELLGSAQVATHGQNHVAHLAVPDRRRRSAVSLGGVAQREETHPAALGGGRVAPVAAVPPHGEVVRAADGGARAATETLATVAETRPLLVAADAARPVDALATFATAHDDGRRGQSSRRCRSAASAAAGPATCALPPRTSRRAFFSLLVPSFPPTTRYARSTTVYSGVPMERSYFNNSKNKLISTTLLNQQ